MISNEEVRLAEWVIKQACKDGSMCHSCEICAHYELCHIQGHDEAPSDWDNPTPPPEPTERPRIEWLRCLPDRDLIDATYKARNDFTCCLCKVKDANCKVFKKYDGVYCDFGLFDWWKQITTLEQFRKEVGLE